MDKSIIILSGNYQGMDLFNNTIRDNGYWTWCINARNAASKSAAIMGCDVENRDEQYYKDLKEFIDLSNRLWNFQPVYYSRMIQKFYNHDKATVLLIHSLNDLDFIEELKEDEGVNTIHIVDREPSNEMMASYDYVLNYRNDNFIEKVTNMLKVFTNNKEIE
jgi:hypothetical protein